jgi:hypothetical protein
VEDNVQASCPQLPGTWQLLCAGGPGPHTDDPGVEVRISWWPRECEDPSDRRHSASSISGTRTQPPRSVLSSPAAVPGSSVPLRERSTQFVTMATTCFTACRHTAVSSMYRSVEDVAIISNVSEETVASSMLKETRNIHNCYNLHSATATRVAQSVWCLSTGWTTGRLRYDHRQGKGVFL